ncbi:MAG: exodeoxyribonuclease [Methanosarcinales archaeon]|nr:MAG: exodeoxyribonuclease [Methanosarcinales archaeon]
MDVHLLVFTCRYVPNSSEKLVRLGYRTKEWDVALRHHLTALQARKPVVLIGDLNVAYHNMDTYNPEKFRNKVAGFCDAERDGFAALKAIGFHDVWREANPDVQQFTYWTPRGNCRATNKGWRLDYALVSEALLPHVVSPKVRACAHAYGW